VRARGVQCAGHTDTHIGGQTNTNASGEAGGELGTGAMNADAMAMAGMNIPNHPPPVFTSDVPAGFGNGVLPPMPQYQAGNDTMGEGMAGNMGISDLMGDALALAANEGPGITGGFIQADFNE